MRLRALALALVVSIATAALPSVAPAAAATTSRPLKVVLLGDSYSAGNGADNYWGPKGCYRSSRNWAEKYLDTLRATNNVTFVNRACSGGVLPDLTNPTVKDVFTTVVNVHGNKSKDDPGARQLLNEQGTCTTRYRDDEAYSVEAVDAYYDAIHHFTTVEFRCTRFMEAQWDAVGLDTDLVLFSIGGNDVHFSSIIQNCFALGLRAVSRCREKIEGAQTDIVGVGARIETFLRDLKRKMRPDAKIVLKAYPYLEKNPDYKLRNLFDTYDVGREIRELGDLGDIAQSSAVDAVNAEGGPVVTFVPQIKPHFAGHEPDGRVCCENESRWVAEFDGLIRMEWYHYNPTGHTEVANVLAGNGDFGAGGDTSPLGSVDIAFVIDTTGSMGGAISSVKAAAIDLVNNVSSRTTSARFALVDYRDFPQRTGSSYDYPAKLNQDFTSSATTINSAIQNLTLGNGGDWPETMFSGITTAFDLTWRPGVKKMAIVLADAPPLSPEPYTGLTGNDIVAQSLAIDPVEMHFVDISGYSSGRADITDIATRTNGGIYRSMPSQAAAEIADLIDSSLDRPYAWAGGPYVGTIGQEFTLDGSGSFGLTSDIVKWEWDVDSDGTYDYVSNSPTTTHTYSEAFDGLVTLRVTDGNGAAGLATVVAHASVDGDETPAASDNCPGDANPGQDDYDNDGIGDVCDPTPGYPTEDEEGVSDNGSDGNGPEDPDGDSTPGSVTDFATPHFNIASTIASAADTADYVGVRHAGGRLQVQLIGLPADYDLVLTNRAGTELQRSANDGLRSESVRADLAPGDYLVGVVPKPGQYDPDAEYRLNVTALGDPPR